MLEKFVDDIGEKWNVVLTETQRTDILRVLVDFGTAVMMDSSYFEEIVRLLAEEEGTKK